MKRFLKRYGYLFIFALIVNTFLICTCTIKSKNELTLPGGLNPVESLIKIEDSKKLQGSFNTVYVYSYDKTTLMQSFLGGLSSKNEVSKKDPSSNLSSEEIYLSGVIQKDQSIEACLISAYNAAKITNPSINLDYNYLGLIVHYYELNQKVLKIGDIIYQVGLKLEDGSYHYSKANDEDFVNSYNKCNHEGDEIYYLRNGKEYKYVIEKDLTKANLNRFAVYHKFNLNEETANPKFTLEKSKTTGPSGGLLQTLCVYSHLTGKDLTKGYKIAGTGTIDTRGVVGPIGGISQKIITALNNDVKLFLCPKEHIDEALKTYEKMHHHKKMIIVEVHTLNDAIKGLEENL